MLTDKVSTQESRYLKYSRLSGASHRGSVWASFARHCKRAWVRACVSLHDHMWISPTCVCSAALTGCRFIWFNEILTKRLEAPFALQRGGWGTENHTLPQTSCKFLISQHSQFDCGVPSADVKRTTGDGACGRRLGDLCDLPAETRSLPWRRPGRETRRLPGQREAARPQLLTRQLHGGGRPLPKQEAACGVNVSQRLPEIRKET